MDRAALLVGIDHYATLPLQGCVADATRLAALLGRHDDGSPNFQCTTLLSSETRITRGLLRSQMRRLFQNQAVDFALFYFAGHGTRQADLGGYLVTQDHDAHDEGVGMADLVTLANQCEARERMIVLDCCHAGAVDELMAAGASAPLAKGTVVLAGCGAGELTVERGGRGLFTSHVCDALTGGAADIQGYVTVYDIYGYLNQVLSLAEQHPALHANLATLRPIRRAKASLEDARLRKLAGYFPSPDAEFQLDPAYDVSLDPSDPEKQRVFRDLQAFRYARLLEPIGSDFMYHAARDSDRCRLTQLGRFYWRKISAGLV